MTSLALAGFAHEAPFREAVSHAEGRWRIVGLWTPMPVEIDDVGEAAAGAIMWTTILGGLAAAILFYAFIWWTATQAYPIDSGGRPLHSWQVFLIAPIEFGALAAAIAGAAAFLVRARMTRLHDAAFEHVEVERASSEHFVMALACDAGEDANALLAWIAEAGAVHSRLVTS